MTSNYDIHSDGSRVFKVHTSSDGSLILTYVDVEGGNGPTVTLVAAPAPSAPSAPDLVSLSPSSGTNAGSTAVTLTGTGFTGVTSVTFGGTAATSVVVASDTTITCVTPAHAAGAVDVVVTSAAGSDTLAGGYTYSTITLSSLSVSTGTGAGGTSVTLTGSGFTGATGVTFGGTSATSVNVVDDSHVTCITPAHTSGLVSVTISNSGGSSTLADSFTYTAGRTVTAISPDFDLVGGGRSVTITGTGFTLATSATIGGIAIGSFAVASDTTITGTAPALVIGTYDITVSGGGMDTVTKSACFTASQWRGVNHNIYSQSTWTAGTPARGTNYQKSDHRLVDYFRNKGMNHMRMMFTWEWLQPTLNASIPGSGAYATYWSDFVDTVNYATGLGMAVTIGHYGFSNNFWSGGGGGTTPSWKGVGSGNGVSYTNQIGGSAVSNSAFADLWTKLATYFLDNNLVSFDLVNEPHDISTMQWFATAQACIDAIRATGSTAWIFIQGNNYASYDPDASYSDTAAVKRSNRYGWANANGTGSPLNDPLNKLIAECHMYMDDAGGSSLDINGIDGGTSANAARDRLVKMVDWARPLGYRVHVGEIGFYAGTAGASTTWANFVAYCDANSDVVTGFDWWAASDIGWWGDTGAAHFSITPTTSGATYSGNTVNMTMIQGDFANP